jgi:hypothetical protein
VHLVVKTGPKVKDRAPDVGDGLIARQMKVSQQGIKDGRVDHDEFLHVFYDVGLVKPLVPGEAWWLDRCRLRWGTWRRGGLRVSSGRFRVVSPPSSCPFAVGDPGGLCIIVHRLRSLQGMQEDELMNDQ